MKEKINKFMKKVKRIFGKIIKDKQLLGIFLLCIAVICAGILVIGLLKTMLIIFVLVVLGLITKFVIDYKNKKENIISKTTDTNDVTNDISVTDTTNTINENIGSEDEKVMKKKSRKKINKKEKKKILSIAVDVFLIFVLFCVIAGFAFIGYIAISAPDFNPSNLYRKESSIVYGSKNEVIAKLGAELRDTITYNDMPQVLIDAIIATEDSRFYQHNGVDFPRFLKATIGQLRGNSAAGGGSTITMQVNKNAYTSGVSGGIKGIIRKFTDVYMSIFKLEKKYTKEQILEYYVNIPFLGSNSFGVSEAANTYFGKSVSDLNLSEAALIAGLFQAPTAYDPYLHPEAASQRRAVVLRLMKRHGYITAEEEEMANAISVKSLLGVKTYTNSYQNFVDLVVSEVVEKTGESPYKTPMKIYTTLDVDKQNHLNDIINGKTYTWVNDKVQVGVAVTNVHTGGIVAISGGRNTVALGLNRATDLNNQPGSTAKPLFDYAPGIEYNNWSTYTPFIDEPWGYTDSGAIKNWDSAYYGFLTLRKSLGLSRNIPALKAFQNVSNSKIYKFTTSLGISVEDKNGYLHEAHALGAFNGTNPLQMAVAYAAFSNGGYYIEPYTVTKVVYLDTNQVKEYKPSKTKVMSDSTAYIITKSLIWAVDSGLSAGAGRIYGREIAVKTGTTNFDNNTIINFGLDYGAVKDYWVAGYTPDVSIALWYGYDNIKDGTNTLADNNRKDRVYNLILRGMLDGTATTFTQPKSVVAVKVENGSIPAMLPSENTPKDLITTEYFKAGTEPTTVSARYQTLSNVTNLNVSVSKGIASLSWDEVKIPEYFTEEYMKTYYKNGMGDVPSSYIKYQKSEFEKLGDFGYDIYIVDSSKKETLVKTVTDTSATIDISKYSGDIKFIVKTAWALEKISESPGSEFTISTSDISTIDVSLNGDAKIELWVGDKFNDIEKPITIIENFVNSTKLATIEKTITNSNNEVVDKIDTSKPETYKIKYTITYKDSKYEKVRTIVVKEKDDNNKDNDD